MAPSPFPGQAGGLWSARGLQVTAALSSCLLTSYPQGSASSPGPGLTEGFCPAVSCARNLPNCRHPRGAEEQPPPFQTESSTPAPASVCPASVCWAYLVPGNQSLGWAAPGSGRLHSPGRSAPAPVSHPHLGPEPSSRPSPFPPRPRTCEHLGHSVHCLVVFLPRALPSEKSHYNPWGLPRRRWGCFSGCSGALGVLACLGIEVCAGVCVYVVRLYLCV